MRINTLQMVNFRNHRDTRLVLERLNYFLGRNNSGKSSILAAVEYALTGRCAWTDRGGRGAGELVQRGCQTATIALEVAGLGAVIRTIGPNSLSVAGRNQAQAAQARIYGALGADADTISATMHTGGFLNLSQDEQRNFLFNCLGLRWDMEKVLGELQELLAGTGYGREEVEQLCRLVRPLYPGGVQAGPEVLEAVEKRLRDRRRDVKRDLQRLTAARQEMVIRYPEGLSTADLPRVKEQYRELLARRDRLLARQAEEKSNLEARLSTVQGAIKALRDSDGHCPLAPELIRCSMAEEEKQALLTRLGQQADSLAVQLQEEDTGLKEMEELERLLTSGEKIIEALQVARRAEEEAAALERDIVALQQEMQHLETLVKAFGPQGLKKHLLGRLLGQFLARVNRNLERITGGVYRLGLGQPRTAEGAPGGGAELLVRVEDMTLPLKALSSSEQFRVGIAIQEALAHFLGLRFLAIDGADILDQANRDLLTGFLLELLEAGEYDQALVFSTIGDGQPQSPELPGVKMFLVQNGGVSEL